MLDTIGYLDFQNSETLYKAIKERLPVQAIPIPPAEINRNQPLYVLKNSVNTDGAVKLMSLIKKSPLRFRTYDSLETPRLSVHEARKQVAASIGVIANLLHIEREGALIDNARSALIAGIAMASSKITWLQLEYDLCLIHRIT